MAIGPAQGRKDLARVEAANGLPVIRVPSGTPPITPETVLRALDED